MDLSWFTLVEWIDKTEHQKSIQVYSYTTKLIQLKQVYHEFLPVVQIPCQ